jgi:hypothetical protein
MQHAGVYGGSGNEDNPWKMQIGDTMEDLTQWL